MFEKNWILNLVDKTIICLKQLHELRTERKYNSQVAEVLICLNKSVFFSPNPTFAYYVKPNDIKVFK